jgi:glycine/D-amino acid oxidase-like deaminating enzyme
MSAVVVGAGAFGGWTALHLLRLGARVALVDAWGAGHPRGTSSDHSRIIRCGYGTKTLYSFWAARALGHWRRLERQRGGRLFVNCGALWLGGARAPHIRASLETLGRLGLPVEILSLRELRRRFPQFSGQEVCEAYFEPQAGYLRAQLATESVAAAVAEHPRGRISCDRVEPPVEPEISHLKFEGNRLARLRLASGRALRADQFIFACGPWLPGMFPQALGRRIRVTRQDVFYFGVPAGDTRFSPPQLPAWIEVSSSFYGIPAGDGRGLKVADDRSDRLFDPTDSDRTPDPQRLAAARAYLGMRIPSLKDAPVVEAKVCQYERTPDSQLVIDRHPAWSNVWLAGGGSGHGFKLGPVVGEFVARLAAGRDVTRLLPPELRDSRAARTGRDPAAQIPAELRLGACAFSAASDISLLRSI